MPPPKVRGPLPSLSITAWVLAYLGAALLADAIRSWLPQAQGAGLYVARASLSLAFLLALGPRMAPVLLLPDLVRGLLGHPPGRPLAWILMGALHAHAYGLAAFLLLRLARVHRRLKTLRDVGWFLLVATSIPLLTAAIGVLFLSSEGLVQGSEPISRVVQSWLGDLVPLCSITPFLLIWVIPRLTGGRRTPVPRLTRRVVLETLAQTAALLALPLLCRAVGPSKAGAVLYAGLLPYLWVGIRWGLPGVALALPVGVGWGMASAEALPWLGDITPLELQAFLAVLSATALLMGAALSERLRSQRLERRQARRLQQLLDGSPVTIATHQGGHLTYINEAGAHLLGAAGPEPLLGMDIRRIVDPGSLELALKRIHLAEAGSPPKEGAEERLVRLDGGTVDVEMHTTSFLEGGAPTIQVVAVDISRRKAAEEKLQGLLRDKELLLREIHHRVKNNLPIMGSLLGLQGTHAKGAEAKEALQEAQGRLRALALIHEHLDQAPQPSAVDLRGYFEQLALRLIHGYTLRRGQVDLDLRVEPVELGVEEASRVGMILNELLSNAFKHTFGEGRRGRLEIRFWREASGTTHLLVRDDGPGVPPMAALLPSKTLGFQILYALADQLGGTLQLQTAHGGCFHLTYPQALP